MSSVPFVTCDLLDDNPDKTCRWSPHAWMANSLEAMVHVKLWRPDCDRKCFEDNSRVKELLATDGTGKVLVVDGGASMRCALMGDLIAESAVKTTGMV